MSNIKLLVLPTVVKDRTSLHTNVDDGLITPEIEAAGDMLIRPMLGSVLYTKILNSANDNTLAGEYLKIFEEYIIKAVCNYVMAALPDAVDVQIWNTGASGKKPDNATEPQMTRIWNVIDKYKKRAEHYSNCCRLYILANLNSFPEYYAPGGVDKVTPDRSVYTCPIYLGGSGRNDGYHGANHNPNYNSNDPYTPL